MIFTNTFTKVKYKKIAVIIIIVSLALTSFFATLLLQKKKTLDDRSKASTVLYTKSDFMTDTGLTEIITDLPSTYSSETTLPGFYQARATSCTDATKDRFEIVFNRVIKNIYGLGVNPPYVGYGINLPDFLDTHFASGSGSTYNTNFDKPLSGSTDFIGLNGDNARDRIPIIVIPENNLIIRYMQSDAKMVRLTRDTTKNTTTIVLKKNHLYSEGTCGSLVVIKGNSIKDAYVTYNRYLKGSYFVKKPNWNAYGLGWQTWNEYACSTSLDKVKEALNYYKSSSIDLSSIIMGSGYWAGKQGCDDVNNFPDDPTMDALAVNNYYGSTEAFKSFCSTLVASNIYPVLGMRHTIHDGNKQNIADKLHLAGVPSTVPIYYPNDNSPKYFGYAPSTNVSLLNTTSPSVMNAYIGLLKNAYGDFRGIKEDEMIVGDQKAYAQYTGRDSNSVINLPDGTVSKAYKSYADYHSNNFMIMGANDYFGIGTDIQNGGGYIQGAYDKTFYQFKYYLDKALRLNVSGLPHPIMEAGVDGGLNGIDIETKPALQKELLRVYQVETFLPGDIQSNGFWHLTDSNIKKTFIYFSNLRERLHNYAFDNAMRWYATGEPTLLRPLFLDFPDDVNIPKLYDNYITGEPVDEFMMGTSLLVRPVIDANNKVNVYLPQGKWKPLIKKSSFVETGADVLIGNRTIQYNIDSSSIYSNDGNGIDYPIFLKEGQILVLKDTPEDQFANVFFDDLSVSNIYTNYNKDGTLKLRFKAIKNGTKVYYVNLATNKAVEAVADVYGKGFMKAKLNDIFNATIDMSTLTK